MSFKNFTTDRAVMPKGDTKSEMFLSERLSTDLVKSYRIIGLNHPILNIERRKRKDLLRFNPGGVVNSSSSSSQKAEDRGQWAVGRRRIDDFRLMIGKMN